MNGQLQTALAELITSTLQAKEFIVGELPEVVRQLLMWNCVYYFIALVAGVLTLAAMAIFNVKHYRWVCADKRRYLDRDGVLRPWVILHILQVFTLLFSLTNLNIQWLQILDIPQGMAY